MRWPEIREVKNPVSPAVAFTENGRTVVEVDEKLKGKARAAAIWAAVRLHEQGLAALVGLPILAFAWEPFKRWTQRHPAAALSTTAAAGSVLTAAAVFGLPMLLDGAEQPRTAEPPITVTATPVRPSPRPTITREPTREPTASSTTIQDMPEPPSEPEIRSVIRPVRTSNRPTSLDPPAAGGPPDAPDPDTPVPRSQGAVADPTQPSTPEPAPEPTAPAAAEPASTPPPASASAVRGCLVRVDVDPLLDACALG